MVGDEAVLEEQYWDTPSSTITAKKSHLEAVSDNWHKESLTLVLMYTIRLLTPPNHFQIMPSGSWSMGFTSGWDKSVYAHDNQSTAPTPWAYHDVDVDEMKAYIGLLILLGTLRLPHLEMYWGALHRYISTSKIMTKTAFDQIFCFLHLVNNVEQSTMLKQATSTTPDKLFKIKPLANLLLESFQSNYILKQEVMID